jgi:hypothetical protein
VGTGITVGMPGRKFMRKKWADRFFFYGFGMYFSTSVSGVTAKFASAGAHAQYKLVTAKRFGPLAGWGGLTLGTGANYTSSFIGMNSRIRISTDTPVESQTATVTVDMNYLLGAQNKVFTIPIEISTNAYLFYILTLYLGGGADINMGSASLVGTASGPVNATYSGGFSGANLFSGTATLNLDDGVTSHPNIVVGRAFTGLQLNLFLLKIAAEYNYLSNGTHGVSVLVRGSL